MSKPPHLMLAALCALATAAFAGCIDPQTAPPASLSVDAEEEAAAGHAVTFAATAKDNMSGDFLFDFGDGASERVEGNGSAQIEHAFASGGMYTVTVSLLDGNETRASAQHGIHIVERHAHDVKVVAAGPLPNETASAEWTVPAGANATRLITNLSLENTMLIGQSVIEVQIVGADGEVLASEEITLDEGANDTLVIEADLPGDEPVTLRATATAGSASIDGESLVRYG